MTKFIVGLGNPGRKYTNTRHNVGHMFVDVFRKGKLSSNYIAVKSDAPMNMSGDYIVRILGSNKLDKTKLYIAFDDLDIPLGKYKIQQGKGPKDHNGVNSVYEALQTKDFYHIRIGVENRDIDNKMDGEKYVLENFTATEEESIGKVLYDISMKIKHG